MKLQELEARLAERRKQKEAEEEKEKLEREKKRIHMGKEMIKNKKK